MSSIGNPVDIITTAFVIGVLLDWLACVINSLGNILMRLDATYSPDPNAPCRKFLTISIICFCIGGIMDVISLAFIPLSIWACGTSVSIPASQIIARWLLGEIMTNWHWISSIIIMVGTVFAVLTGCRSSGEHAYNEFIDSWRHPTNLAFAILTLIIQAYCVLRNWEYKQLLEHQQQEFRNSMQSSDHESNSLINMGSMNSIGSAKSPINLKEFDSDVQIYDFNEIQEDINLSDSHASSPPPSTILLSPHDSRSFENEYMDRNWFLVIIGALLPAVQTCWTNLLIKSVVELLSSIWHSDGKWVGIAPWLCTLALLISAPLQLMFIQWMMACHECVVIVPVYQCLLIVVTSFFGIGFFNERPISWGGFLIAMFVSCFGILIMAVTPKPKRTVTQAQAHIHKVFQKVGVSLE